MRKLSRLLLLVVLASVIAACGWNPDVTPVAITAPWDSMNLPVKQDAIVWASDTKELKVVHKADKAALLDSYSKAIEAHGWKLKDVDRGFVTFTKEGKELELELYDFRNTGVILTLK